MRNENDDAAAPAIQPNLPSIGKGLALAGTDAPKGGFMQRFKVVFTDGGTENFVGFVNADTLDEAWEIAREQGQREAGGEWSPVYVGSAFES